MKYLPGADLSRLYDNRYSGTHWPDGPDVLLFHTTETTGLPGYSNGGSAPNATFDIKRRKVWQHFSCNRSSRALVDRPGGAVTNRARVFQVELICYSDRSIANSIGRPDLWVGNLTDADLRWIAQQVAPLVKAYPIPFTLTPKFTKNPRYGTGAPQRMSAAEWGRFSGWTGHAYVPENSHWDPGALDIPKIMTYCKALVGGTTPTPKEPTPPVQFGVDEVKIGHSQHNKDHKVAVSLMGARHLPAHVYHNLVRMGFEDTGEVVTDDTIRWLSGQGTARGGVVAPGFDLNPRSKRWVSRDRRLDDVFDDLDDLRDILTDLTTPAPDPEPDPKPSPMSASELFRAAGFTGKDLNVALAVSFLESGGYVDAVGDLHMVGKDNKWGPSVGLFQMLTMQNPPTSGYVPDTMRDIEKLRDPLYQAKAAKALLDAKGWGQWTMHPDSGKRPNYDDYERLVGEDYELKTGHHRAHCWSLTGCPDK